MDQVVKHLNLLYRKSHPVDEFTGGGGGSEAYQEADRFLERFQKSIEAWNISVQLLVEHSIPDEYQLFAAQSLRRKVVHDLAQLDFNELASIKETVLLLLKSSKEASKPLLTQISLTIIYLAMQIDPVLWADPIGDILNIYNDGFLKLNGLVLFLTLFPYECKHPQVTLEAGQEENIKGIQSMYALKILTFVFEIGNSQGWTRDLLDCLLNWVKYGIRSEQECVRCLNSLPLLDLAFSGLKLSITSPECAPICCEIVNEIIFKTSTIPNLSTSIPLQVFRGLQSNFECATTAAKQEEDGEDFVIAWIDLCSEFCWSCEELMESQSDVFLSIMDMIVTLSNPERISIMERTFSYWEGIVGIFDRFQSLASDEQVLQRIDKLVLVLLRSMELPAELEDVSANSQELEDWTHYCQGAQEILVLYTAEVLSETRAIQLIIRYATTSNRKQAVLSAFRASKAIAKNLREPTPLLTSLYSLLSDKDSILAYIKLLAKITHFDMIGRELDLIKCCLDDFVLFQEAILALKNIFHQSSSSVSPHSILEWIKILTEKSGSMPDFVQLEVCGCMASLLSRVPVEMSIPVYSSLIKDVVVRSSLEDPQDCIDAMEKVAIILKNATPSHHQPLSHVLMEQWSLFQHISDRFGDRVNVMESLARALKYLVICNGAILGPVVEFSIAQFSKHLLSWPVYLLRYFLREFCNNPEHMAIITRSMTEISNRLFSSTCQMEQISDVFVDFFKLLSLHTTVTCNVEWRCFELAVSSFAGAREWTPYSDVIRAVFSYLTSCLKCLNTSKLPAGESPDSVQRAVSLFSGPVLFRVLYGVLLEYPSSLVYPVAELLTLLATLYPPLSTMLEQMLHSVLQELPHFTGKERERQSDRFRQIISRHDLDELESFLYTLARTTQRRLA